MRITLVLPASNARLYPELTVGLPYRVVGPDPVDGWVLLDIGRPGDRWLRVLASHFERFEFPELRGGRQPDGAWILDCSPPVFPRGESGTS